MGTGATMIRYLKKSLIFWMGAIATAVAIFFLSQIYLEISREIKFASYGRITTGTVEGKREDKETVDGRTHSYLVVSYVFDPLTSLPQKGEGDVDEARFDALNPGDKIDIQFVAGEATLNRIAGGPTFWSVAGIVGAMTGLFLAIGLSLSILAIRRARRQSRLWTHGIAHRARIVKFSRWNPHSKEDQNYLIEYEYDIGSGEKLTGKSLPHDRSWFGRIGEGEEIDIVVDPQNPGVSEWRKEME